MKRLKSTTLLPLPNNFIQNIRDYYNNINLQKDVQKRQKKVEQMIKSINIWLKFYPETFKRRFFDALNIPFAANKLHIFEEKEKKHLVKKALNNYIEKLIKSPSLKIFIGRDAFILYTVYRETVKKFEEKKNDSIFIKFSRPFLFSKSNDLNYIMLTELIHKNTISNPNFSTFYSHYSSSLDNTDIFYKRIRKKILVCLNKYNLVRKLNEYKTFQIIDSGMQGGLALPLVRVLQNEGYSGTFSLFYCFPWLKKIFKGKVYTQNINFFEQLEYDSIHLYNSYTKRRA